MKKLLFLVSLTFVIYSCNDSFEEVEPVASSAANLATSESPLLNTLSQADYNRGLDAGKNDGKDLIDDTFYESNCLAGLLFQVKNENEQCYFTTPSQLEAMNDFIEDYNANLDQLINSTSGATRDFHSGVKDGFNLEVCAFGYKYGYATFCAFVGEGPVDGSGGPGGPGGPGNGGEGPIDTGDCGDQLICG